MDQARVVIVGGGITGVSVAYHLALAGWTDVLLLEKAQLTAGSTCQAAGLVTMFNPSATMMRFRRTSIELYGRLGVFTSVGSLRLASSHDQLLELQRTSSRARGIGLEVEVITAGEALRLMPAASPESLYGAVHLPADGHLDPHAATHAVADAARALGVRIRTGVRVTGFELSARREVERVMTDQGEVATELVIDAAGIWAPQVAAMVGGFVPSTPVDHQHIALRAVPRHELPADLPAWRDPDNLVYGKSEQGGMLFGGYEAEPNARWIDGVPWDHAARALPPDYERFAPLMAGAIRRFPFLADAEVVRLVCHPDAMTPDANPLLGPIAGVRGFWLAAGLSLNGFGGAGGIGQALAGWITAGDPGLDIGPYRAWRFGPNYHDPTYAAALARETYADYYRLRYPYDADEAGRPRRLSAVHGRLQEAGAVFGSKAGWERVDHLEPGAEWRRSGRDQRAFGWTEPPWFGRVVAEGRSVRERVGLIDLSSFGKIDIEGPGSLGLLQGVCANDVERPVGSVTYSQWLDGRGGIVADVTVTRLADARFRVVTGSASVSADLAWLEAAAAAVDGHITLHEVSDELACLGLWGPRARDVLATATADDVSDAAIRARTARRITVAGAPVLASRISYAGELGWELTTDRRWATAVWDALWRAGADHGLAPFGYRALDGLRMEKGYRAMGTDLTMLESPFEAGLGAFVRLERGPFIGRDALRERVATEPHGPTRRLRTLVLDSDTYEPCYGGEAVRIGREVVGRLRSVAYGPTVGRTIAYALLSSDLANGEPLTIDVFDRRLPATVADDGLVDPGGERMRG